ncbi:unnamed protein product [Rotaria magnacalcarata]|uniref:Uncharacterized protein n=1 Tax=Rotaria magnacalcarata TaxID=392030 RepID=A0A820F151_9BILA|nr:unnamed protein product [Rotaria magnacalcarata]
MASGNIEKVRYFLEEFIWKHLPHTHTLLTEPRNRISLRSAKRENPSSADNLPKFAQEEYNKSMADDRSSLSSVQHVFRNVRKKLETDYIKMVRQASTVLNIETGASWLFDLTEKKVN